MGNTPPAPTLLPPPRSTGIWTDFLYFLWNRPEQSTLIRFHNDAERDDYNHRILQRIGVNMDPFVILNLHHIGINVPVKYVYEELEKWNGDSTCWPNHLAHVERIQDADDDIVNIYLLGKKHLPFGLGSSFFGFRFIPLFTMKAFRIEAIEHFELDNARYMLYRCTGGYPIGIFSMFVRTPMEEHHEKEIAQLFLLVSFNFFGKNWMSRNWLIRNAWAVIHNRVTSHIMIRFKKFCEWRFQQFLEKEKTTGV